MPTNNNGNSKADALHMVDMLDIDPSTNPRTFMDCLKIATGGYVEMKKEKFLVYIDCLERFGIKECKDLGELMYEHRTMLWDDYCDCSPEMMMEIIDNLREDKWGRRYTRNLLGYGTFQKWCVGVEPDGHFETILHEQRSYTTNRFKKFVLAMKGIVDISCSGNKTKKLEEKIATLKKSNELFMEEIDTLNKVITDNNIELNMCELCNKQLGDDDLDDDGKTFTKCGAQMCKCCIQKIEPTKNSTPTDANTEILCPQASIPFVYFKTKCPYCRQSDCLPKYNEYKELVVEQMKSLIGWSHKGKTPLKPSFVRSCNVMYKITGRSYLTVRTLQ